MPSTTVSRGNVQNAVAMAATITPTAVTLASSAEQSVTVPGILAGDVVSAVVPPSAQTAGIVISYARVTAANTVAINFGNVTAGNLTPVAGLYTFHVLRPENQPLPTTAA